MTLVTHCGARQVTEEELARVPTPAPTQTWFPMSHLEVLKVASFAMKQAGFSIRAQTLALSRHDTRFFATLDTAAELVPGVSIAVGLRNSVDRSLPMGFLAGSRVFVCDNLAFSSDIRVQRKHTKNGSKWFSEGISQAVQSLNQFREEETERIRNMQRTALSPAQRESLILRAWEHDIISTRHLPVVLNKVRVRESIAEGAQTAWTLFNDVTSTLAGMRRGNPERHARATLSLQFLFSNRMPPD